MIGEEERAEESNLALEHQFSSQCSIISWRVCFPSSMDPLLLNFAEFFSMLPCCAQKESSLRSALDLRKLLT